MLRRRSARRSTSSTTERPINTGSVTKIIAAPAVLMLLAGLTACGAGNVATAPPGPTATPSATPTLGVILPVAPIQLGSGLAPTPPTATIKMYTDAPFQPQVLTVAPATVINVINEGSDICNLTDNIHGLGSNDLGPGASVHITAPDTPGTYDYNCSYYPQTMKGTLIVSKAVTTPASATPVTATPTPAPTETSAPATNAGTGTDTGTGSGSTDTGSGTSGDTGSGDTGSGGTGGSGDTGSGDTGGSGDNSGIGLAHPEKCVKASFRDRHPNACAKAGY